MAKLLTPLTETDIKQIPLGELRKEYMKLADFYLKIVNEELVFCSRCQTWKNVTNFYSSRTSPDGIEHCACRECILDMCTDYDKKTKIRTDNRNKTVAVFKKLDWYFNEKTYNDQLKLISEGTGEKVRGTAVQQWIVMCRSLTQYQGLTFAHSEFINSEDGTIEVETNKKPRKEIIKLFGSGFTIDDYLYMQTQYDDWCERTEVDSKSQQVYITQIVIKQMEIWKAQKQGKDTDKLIKSLNDLMNGANLQPRQNVGNAATDALTFSQLIAKWELEKPIPTPDPDLCDVSGIGKKIRVWFAGWLGNALGLDIPQTQEYLEEVEKYTVTKPKVDDREEGSSMIFTKMFGNSE